MFPIGSGGVPAGGSLGQEVLRLLNEAARLEAAGLKGSLAWLQNAQALKAAQLAEQAATGSQQGIANVFRQGAGVAGGGLSGVGSFMPDPASFLTPEFSAQHPEMAGILNAPSLLDQGLAAIFGLFGRGDGGLPNAQQVPGGFSPLPEMGPQGDRAPMPTASQPVRFLPGQQQGSQFPGSPQGPTLPGVPGPIPHRPRPSPTKPSPKPLPKTRFGPGRRS